MSRPLHVRPPVFREVQALARYLALEASPTVARRFRSAVERSFADLADMPDLGSPWEGDDPQLAGIRTWPVSGFRNYLIFYRPLDDRIEILHLLHGSQDIDRRLQDLY